MYFCLLHAKEEQILEIEIEIREYSKCSKFSNFFRFLFSNMLVFRAGIHKMLARIANSEDPDKSASSEARAFFHHFWTMTHTPGIRNFSAKMQKIGNFLSAFDYILSKHKIHCIKLYLSEFSCSVSLHV